MLDSVCVQDAGDLIALLGFIALALPNTLQFLSRYEPALGVKAPDAEPAAWARLAWSASLIWAIGVSILAAVAVYRLGGNSEFLYWQF